MRDWLVIKRETKKFTQEQVAEKAGIERTYYNMIEKGKRRPSPDVAIKIGSVLSFDWTIFFNTESNKTTQKEVVK
ncbi:helix-turn-helix domain-containing protein [Enterococcus thailandicus]|uniref:helix-turn-helix domain-containing protein n=1 Tax=Enterococcus thailandicus TaxID=417368 RepID=UPI0022E15141|nr:helix-turn-helix transcriptional regulator [Enterococcus thailandicus]